MRQNSSPIDRHAQSTPSDVSDIAHLTVMDANCAICARGARWIAKNDTRGEFRIVPMQSDLGRKLLVRHGLDPDDPSSWLYLDQGVPYSSLDAVIRVAGRLGGVWRALGVLRVLPKPVQDRLYYAVARNRYRLFGRADLLQCRTLRCSAGCCNEGPYSGRLRHVWRSGGRASGGS